MKKLILCLFVVLLSACDGITDMLAIPMPPTARDIYESAGGDQINFHAVNPGNPVTVIPVANGTNFDVTLLEGCVFPVDVTAIAGAEAPFWMLQPVTLTYDADIVQCGSTVYCDYSAIMIGSSADVSITCYAQ